MNAGDVEVQVKLEFDRKEIDELVGIIEQIKSTAKMLEDKMTVLEDRISKLNVISRADLKPNSQQLFP